MNTVPKISQDLSSSSGTNNWDLEDLLSPHEMAILFTPEVKVYGKKVFSDIEPEATTQEDEKLEHNVVYIL